MKSKRVEYHVPRHEMRALVRLARIGADHLKDTPPPAADSPEAAAKRVEAKRVLRRLAVDWAVRVRTDDLNDKRRA